MDVVELHDEEERGPSSTGEWGGGGERVSWGSGASAASEVKLTTGMILLYL